MQKLTGISWGQNNKSCRIFHHECNKFCLAFFWFFYSFIRNLQETARTLLLFQIHFTAGTLERKGILPKCPWFAFRPSERVGPLQSDPPGWPAAVRPEIPARAGAGPVGDGGERVYGSLAVGLGTRLGLGAAGRAGTLVAQGGGRRGCLFWRGGDSEEWRGEPVSNYKRKGGWWGFRLGKIASRTRCSPWRPSLAPTDSAVGREEGRPSP
jgi:hypothetical protein